MKPIIGVTPLTNPDTDETVIRPGYFEALTACGAIPVMLPYTNDVTDIDQILGHVDGILLTGGYDVDPHLYGESPLPQVDEPQRELDALQMVLVPRAVSRDLPVLGICRGIQVINVALGGNLVQDIPTQCPQSHTHRMDPPFDAPRHDVSIVEGSPLGRLLDGEPSMGVNSKHHQALRELAPGIEPMAWSDDGLVEAVWMPQKSYVWAVQWHPELMFASDSHQRRLIESFVAAAQEHASAR